jgi:orotate phosphoribosyltransferase
MDAPSPSLTQKERMSNILIKSDAIKFGIYKLTSGKASPYYIDLRIIPSFPDAFREICNFYSEYITNRIGIKNFDRIAAIPLSGIPFASQIAYNLKKPFLYMRKDIRMHGRKRRVEGILVSGDKVLLIDDLLTTGLTLKKASDALRAEGGVVTEALVFIDRNEGGRQLLLKNGIKLHALLHISEIARTLHEMGAIDEDRLKTITKQIKKQ